mgnify:CR=1 FL=1
MELYWIYLAIFGGTTIVGVPMLSFMQYKFIHGMPVSAWIEGLPLTFVIVAILWITIAIIMRFVMQPVIKAMKKANTTELSDEEKLSFIYVFKKMAKIIGQNCYLAVLECEIAKNRGRNCYYLKK